MNDFHLMGPQLSPYAVRRSLYAAAHNTDALAF